MKKWLVLISMFAVMLPASALQKLNFDGFIADEAHLLSPAVKENLNMTLWDLQKKSGADIAVVTLPSLNGKTVEQTALEIGRGYKIGSKEKNNGVVFLTALNERRMRIELGYGLENKISMSSLERIRDKDILPYYKSNDYESGIARGTYKLAELVANAEGVTISQQGDCPQLAKTYSRRSSRESYPWWFFPLVLLFAFLPGGRGSCRSYGRGFGGGGGFGGCGCSGSW